jgi:hypothetical protein
MLTARMQQVRLTCAQEARPFEKLTLLRYCADVHKAAEVFVESRKAEQIWRAAVSTRRLVEQPSLTEQAVELLVAPGQHTHAPCGNAVLDLSG